MLWQIPLCSRHPLCRRLPDFSKIPFMAINVSSGIRLKDAQLFRQACYIDGAWVEAGANGCDRRRQSGNRRNHRDRSEARACRDAAGDRRGRARLSGVAPQDRQGTRRSDAPMVRPDDGEPGRPRAPDDDRAGQAADRIERRSRLCRVVSRMVRRGSQARLRRHHSAASARQAHRRHQGTDRRRGVHHAVEFSARDDHAQGRPGDRGGMHGRAEARIADAVLRARAGRARRARRHARRASST